MTFADAQEYVGTDPISGIGQLGILVREGLRREHDVLEIGCGTLNLGRVLIPWLEVGRYCGIDPNPWLRNAARIANPEIGEAIGLQHARFADSSDFRWPSASRGFDVIFSHSVLSHASRDQLAEFMAAVRDQLNPGGFCLASVNIGETVEDDTARDEWAYPEGVWVSQQRLRSTAEAFGLTVEERPDHRRTIMALHPEEAHHWVALR